MEFFNKKEEVLDFKLTEYGKYLLSIGRLKPVYYAFFDDDILYDVAGSGMTESPNMSEGRIQSKTPSLKVIPTRTSAEKRVNSFVQQITDLLGPNSDPADKVEIFSHVESFEEKGKINAHTIGRSSLTSRHNPAWTVEVLSIPRISSAVSYLNDNGMIENTPQLNIDVDYKMFFSDGAVPGVQQISLNDSSLFLSVENNYLMIEVMENNTDFEKENFEIEVFHSASGTRAPNLSDGSPGKLTPGEYVQLSYTPEDPNSFITPMPIQNDLNIAGNVGYYFNLMVDDDIPDETLISLGIPPLAVATNASRLNINRDIYTTDPEDPC